MTNTQHTTRQKNTKTRALVMMAILLALSLSLLAVQQRANAVTFPGIYTVNSTADAPDTNHNDNTCDANLSNVPVCTLRAAIEQANAHPGADAIRFAIPGSGVHTIHVNSGGYGALPAITDTVTIDGYTQGEGTPGDPSDDATKNTLAKGTNAVLKIELDGSQVPDEVAGLQVTAPDTVVKGFVINRFAGGIGVGDGANNTRIEGNFIGTDPSGTLARGNSEGGLYVRQSSNVAVGGSSPEARNLISGNGESVFDHGISILGDGNTVYGNLIGTQRDGKSPLGNSGHGVEINSTNYQSSSLNSVGETTLDYANTIAFNGGDGVSISLYDGPASYTAFHNVVLSNSIFSNKGLGIDLGDDGVTPNDAGDADTGSNTLQNKPVLSSAKKSAGKTTIKGKLNSSPNYSFIVQFFSNPKATNEGKKLLFSKSVTTNGKGNVSFTFATQKKVGLGQNITATATNFASADTSEFSAPRKVVAS